jgi:ATP-binding cassette subfamily B (MDR/TAP) protein 9
MSLPDTPVLLAAFAAGAAAALMAALVPYYTGLIIDFASIEPNRRAAAPLSSVSILQSLLRSDCS